MIGFFGLHLDVGLQVLATGLVSAMLELEGVKKNCRYYFRHMKYCELKLFFLALQIVNSIEK